MGRGIKSRHWHGEVMNHLLCECWCGSRERGRWERECEDVFDEEIAECAVVRVGVHRCDIVEMERLVATRLSVLTMLERFFKRGERVTHHFA